MLAKRRGPRGRMAGPAPLGRAVDPCWSARAESSGPVADVGRAESGQGDPSRVGQVSAQVPAASGPRPKRRRRGGFPAARPMSGPADVTKGGKGGTKLIAVFKHAPRGDSPAFPSSPYLFSFDSDARPFVDRWGRPAASIRPPYNERPRSRPSPCTILPRTASLHPGAGC